MIRTYLVNLVKSRAPRIVALVVGPVITLAAPFIVKGANGWLSAGLTTQQVTQFGLAAMGLISVKVLTYLITHFKLNKAALDKIPLVNDITPLNSAEAKLGTVAVAGNDEVKAQLDGVREQLDKLAKSSSPAPRSPRARKPASADK